MSAASGRGVTFALFRRLRMTRWVLRCCYAFDRLSRALKLLEVRVWRKALIQLYYRHTDWAPPPSMITLRLTSNCNLRCVQCGQWGTNGVFNRPGRTPFPREMSAHEWQTFIEDIAPFCPHIYFFGGEPFLRKDCLDLVRCAASKGVITGINTNGNFLKGRGPDLVESGLDYLIVSLDGPKEINNQIRLGKLDVYATVVEGVEELVRAKKERASRYPLIELCMTLTETNQAHIMETATLAWRLGVNYFAVTFGIFTTPALAQESAEQLHREFGATSQFFTGFVRDVSKMDPNVITSQIREVKQLWGSRYKQYPPVKFSVADYYQKPERSLVDRPCIAPWVTMQIMPNGDMTYCADFPDLVVGNVRTDGPLALWNSPTSRSWRHRIRAKGILPAETRCCDYYIH